VKFLECLKDAQQNALGDVKVMLFRVAADGGSAPGSPSAVWDEIDGITFDGTFYPADLIDFDDWGWMEI
jgi:hypothetical protein